MKSSAEEPGERPYWQVDAYLLACNVSEWLTVKQPTSPMNSGAGQRSETGCAAMKQTCFGVTKSRSIMRIMAHVNFQEIGHLKSAHTKSCNNS